MDFLSNFHDNDNHASPKSLPPSATPRSVALATPFIPRPIDVSLLQPNLQNIVSTVNLGCQLDLKRITLQARNTQYNPERFVAVIMRIRHPRTTAFIFGSGKMKYLIQKHYQFCNYEPETFPGLIYKMMDPKIVLLIFASGKVVLTGAKVRDEIDEAFEQIYPILKGFRK